LSIIRLVNYSVTTSLLYKVDNIGDAQDFSVIFPIASSESFSSETLIEVEGLCHRRLSWIRVSPL